MLKALLLRIVERGMSTVLFSRRVKGVLLLKVLLLRNAEKAALKERVTRQQTLSRLF